MARNIEIKARVGDADALARRVAACADTGPRRIEQDDTFFDCPNGRLKLRDFLTTPAAGELIFYRRTDATGPTTSFYERQATPDPTGMRRLLAAAFGEIGRVRKTRRLYMIGRTRVHLDDVAGLGTFMELEVVLGDDEPSEAGMAEAHALMANLAIDEDALVEGAYVDLLAEQAS